MEMHNEKLVEVIEGGRIAKVPEYYARREGLPILRKVATPKPVEEKLPPSGIKTPLSKRLNQGLIVDNFRKHDWKEDQVLQELVENFHWKIRVERRRQGFTRRQLAKKIGEQEENLRKLENGILPMKDFILIHKVQDVLGIKLRKGSVDYTKSAHEMMKENEALGKSREKELRDREHDAQLKQVYGEDIEILEDF